MSSGGEPGSVAVRERVSAASAECSDAGGPHVKFCRDGGQGDALGSAGKAQVGSQAQRTDRLARLVPLDGKSSALTVKGLIELDRAPR